MNIVTQNYDLDMIPGDVPLIVPVKQYDNTSRQIQFTLYSGSNAFILQSTASVRCDGTKPDGNGFSETCSYSGNVVTLVVTQQMAAVSGNVPCQLTVTDGTGVIGTATFILFVWPAALNGGTVVSDSDVAAIIAQAQAAANSAAEAESAASEALSAVSSKADKAQPSAANNVALLSADGNLLDSGKQLTPGAIGALPAVESQDYPGCYYITGTDDQPSWINPPMEIGVEYLTTEMYNGKHIYTKLVSVGKAVNGGNGQFGLPFPYQLIRCSAYSTGGLILPYGNWGDAASINYRIAVNEGQWRYYFYVGSAYDNKMDVCFQCWYTKEAIA